MTFPCNKLRRKKLSCFLSSGLVISKLFIQGTCQLFYKENPIAITFLTIETAMQHTIIKTTAAVISLSSMT